MHEGEILKKLLVFKIENMFQNPMPKDYINKAYIFDKYDDHLVDKIKDIFENYYNKLEHYTITVDKLVTCISKETLPIIINEIKELINRSEVNYSSYIELDNNSNYYKLVIYTTYLS